MRNRFWAGLCLTTGLTTPAAAESWYQIATTDESIEFADADSVRNTHGVTRLTIFRGLAATDKPFAKADVELKCASNEFRLTRVQNFGSSKQYLSTDEGPGSWTQIAANSVAEAARQFACDGELRDTLIGDPFAAAEEYFYYYYY